MQKIVVGIIAVFFVQITFQVFNAVERTNDEYVGISNFSSPSDDVELHADVDQLHVESEFLSEVPAALAVQRRQERRPEPVRANYRQPVNPKATPAKSLFPPVVITATARSIANDERPMTASFVEKKKGKSVPAKALTVIKKPYDWMKSAFSKLL